MKHDVRFEAILIPAADGDPRLSLVLPDSASEELHARGKRFPVAGSIDGIPFRALLHRAPDSSYLMHISLPLKVHAGLSAGQRVRLEMVPDVAPPKPLVPPDLREALEEDPIVARTFDHLDTEQRRQVVVYVGRARTALGRARRLAHVQMSLRRAGR